MSEELTKEQKLNQCFFRYVGFFNFLAESREKPKELSRFNEREILARFRENYRFGSSFESLKYIQKYLDELPDDLSYFEREKIEEIYLLMAGLFGLYPSLNWNSKDKFSNLGKSFYEYEREVNKNKKKSKDDLSTLGSEKRFMSLIRANEEDLPKYLQQAIQLMKSKKIPINWFQLLKDIRNWNNEKINVQRNWARGFWGSKKTEEEKGEEKQ